MIQQKTFIIIHSSAHSRGRSSKLENLDDYSGPLQLNLYHPPLDYYSRYSFKVGLNLLSMSGYIIENGKTHKMQTLISYKNTISKSYDNKKKNSMSYKIYFLHCNKLATFIFSRNSMY